MQRRFFFVLVVSIFSCNSSKEESSSTPFRNCTNFKYQKTEYSNSDLKFKVNLPSDYEVFTDNVDIQVIGSKLSENNNYLESVGVNVSNNSIGLGLDEVFIGALEADQRAYDNSVDIQNYELLGKGSIIINDYDFRWILHTYTEAEQRPLSLLDFYHVNDELAYKFTFASFKSDMDSLVCKYEKIIDSIIFL